MKNILKSLREAAGLTQEAVAEKLGVTVNTIQNWERSDRLNKESLHDLLDLYNIEQQKRNSVVLAIFGKNVKVSADGTADNLPYFLLSDRQDVLEAAKRANLTVEEMELFGYSYYMSGLNDANRSGYGPSRWALDYSVFKDFGGYFNTMSVLNRIEYKIGNFFNARNREKGIVNFVYNYGLRNPGEGFCFVQMDAESIEYELQNLPEVKEPAKIRMLGIYCKTVREPILLGTSLKPIVGSYGADAELDPVIGEKIVKVEGGSFRMDYLYSLKLNEVCSKCFEIVKKEMTYPEYLEQKAQYLSDREAFDKHPNLYDREPSFKFQYEYWLKLSEIGEEYLRWYEG